MTELPSVRNAVQSSEMMRNSLGLNYKSAALPAEPAKCRALDAPRRLKQVVDVRNVSAS